MRRLPFMVTSSIILLLGGFAGYYFPSPQRPTDAKKVNLLPLPLPKKVDASARQISRSASSNVDTAPFAAGNASRLEHLVNGDSAALFQYLVDEKRRLPEKEWLELRANLIAALRPYAQKEYLSSLARWEDPTGSLRMKIFDAWKQAPSGRHFQETISKMSDTSSMYELMAGGNLTRDWLAFADCYSQLENIPPVEHAKLMDLVVGNWIAQEGTSVAAAWLSEHPNDAKYDLARRTVYLSSEHPDASLTDSMASDEMRQFTLKVSAALR